MPVTVRVQPVREAINLVLAATLSPQARSAALADYAATAIAEVDAANDAAAGRDVQFRTFVDGREDAPLASVRPDGVVVAVWDIESATYAEIVEMVRANSPVRSGRFRDTILFLADGVQADPANPPPADEYLIISPQPYARKIERGMSPQAPDGVFESVAVIAQRRFGNVARVRFTYRSLVGGAVGAWAGSTSMRGGRRAGRQRQDWLTRQPAIVITPRGR